MPQLQAVICPVRLANRSRHRPCWLNFRKSLPTPKTNWKLSHRSLRIRAKKEINWRPTTKSCRTKSFSCNLPCVKWCHVCPTRRNPSYVQRTKQHCLWALQMRLPRRFLWFALPWAEHRRSCLLLLKLVPTCHANHSKTLLASRACAQTSFLHESPRWPSD